MSTKQYESFDAYLKSMLTDEQCEALRIMLGNTQPVAFYGKGLGKSVLAFILRKAGYHAFAPEDVSSLASPYTVPAFNGVVAFCLKNKDEFAAVVTTNSFKNSDIHKWVSAEKH